MEPHALIDHIQRLGERERAVLAALIQRKPIARDASTVFVEDRTFGERLADQVASFGGSWTFIMLFVAAMGAWIIWNSQGAKPYDPFPFILLNLMLSCLAALQAPVIMMSQNRQGERDRLDAHNDYEINLKAEMEVMSLHEKLDHLRDRQWGELVELQARQLELLEKIHQALLARST
ncbi:MAG: DUF1003 domain-containing protein [Bryobacteraceae bacterium]